MPCERGLYGDIKKQSIFQKCLGKFLTIFTENLDRVPPCLSTWHKLQRARLKILRKDPFSGPLKTNEFSWLYMLGLAEQLNFIILINILKRKMCRIIQDVKKLHAMLLRDVWFSLYYEKTPST